MSDTPNLSASERREALWLALTSVRIPVGTILISLILLSGVASATATVWSYGPVNPLP